jgi:hypothetical protein
MVTGDFRQLISPQGFRPFRLILSAGHVYDVRHPEMARVLRTTILVHTPRPDGQATGTPIYVSLLHVIAIEFLDDLQHGFDETPVQPPPASGDDETAAAT